MNFETFVTNNLIANQAEKSNTAQEVKSLLPPMQQTRPYKDIEKQQDKLNITLRRYYFGEDRNEWKMIYYVQWPIDMSYKVVSEKATDQQFKQFALEYIKSRSERGDEKYVKIERSDKQKMIFTFDTEKWFNDNFKTLKPKYDPPLSLLFEYKTSIPLYIQVDSPPNDLKSFISKKFQDWVMRNSKKLKNENFSFIKKIVPSLFEFAMNTQRACFIVSLKYSVIFASFTGYMLYRYKKSFDKKEIDVLKKKVKSISDIKNLDKLIKSIK